MLKIYQRLWQVNWAEQWQYRANLVMYLLYWLVSPVVYLSVWTSIARVQGSIQGYTPTDFVSYYLMLLVVDQLTSEITIHILAYKIQDGTLSAELLKPIHPILTGTLVNNLAFKALILMVFIPVWLLLCLLFQPDFSAVTLQTVLPALPALVLGFAINFLFGALITCLAFWTTRVYSVSEFYYALTILFAGQFVPLDLMPQTIQNIAQYSPFPIMRYIPIQILLGRMPSEKLLFHFGVAVVWLVIALALFLWVWRAGVKRFSAVGA
jgi:ABC-2 type transport system permease protein